MPFTANQSYSAYIPLSNVTSATISGSVPSGISATVDIPGQKVVISGIPTVPGQVFNFTITAANDCNPNYSITTTSAQTFSGFVITPPPPPPPPLPPGCIIFNSLYPPAGQPEVYKKSHGRYTAFLNTYGVWESNTYGPSFDRTYTFYVPISETYKIICSCDNIGYVYIDGVEVLQAPGFGADYSIDISLSVGNHTIRTYGINSGGEASMATVVTRQSNTGCSAYPSFSSPVIDTGPTVPDATGGGGDFSGGGFESSGGGGGGGKVICTELYHMGMMSSDIFKLDQEYGQWLVQNDPKTYWGYRAWADILIDLMRGDRGPYIPKLFFWMSDKRQREISRSWALTVANFLGQPFAEELAYRVNSKKGRRTWLGYALVQYGQPICSLIGTFSNKYRKQKKQNVI